jgi:plastocyanin
MQLFRRACLSLIFLAAIAGATPSPSVTSGEHIEPGSISGQLVLIEDGEVLGDGREFASAVVYFHPQDATTVPAAEQPHLMTTRRRQFDPRVLTITTGSEVIFPNEDPILHNVFSSSAGNAFDLGLYARSEGKTHRFDRPGLVRVFCNVHPAMSAHIVVLDTAHFISPDKHGRFRLSDLPAGPGRLTVWHERSEPLHRDMVIERGDSDIGQVELALTVRQIAPQRERLRRPPRRGRY